MIMGNGNPAPALGNGEKIQDGLPGDGDCGITRSRGAKAVLDGKAAEATHADTLMHQLARCVSDSMGGPSGALFELCFRAAAAAHTAAAVIAFAMTRGGTRDRGRH